MKLSRTVAYAIQALVDLGAAGANATVPSRKLALSGDIPDRFLLQILRMLVAHGLLRSTRGVVGGYTLARGLEEISLLDIIEAVEGTVSLELPVAPGQAPRFAPALREVSAGVRRELAAMKLSQLRSTTKES